jgi:hypothetical protein
MSLPLCVMNLVVSSLWALYGFLLWDMFILVPNVVGAALGAGQVALIGLYPGPLPELTVEPEPTASDRRGGASLEYKV